MEKNGWPFFLWLLVFFVCSEVQASDRVQKNAYANWPPGWVSAYERFENFIRQKQENFPQITLEVSPDGKISHDIQFHKGRAENLSFTFIRNGTQRLSTGLSNDRSDGIPNLIPGKYALIVESTGFLGYQSLYPITWIDISAASATNDSRSKDDTKPFFKVVDPPKEAEKHWPNERLEYFFDFHILPKHFPSDILVSNTKVNPSVRIWVDNKGTITREKLDESQEKALHWRIYHNGKLIERATARNTTQKILSNGPGTYQVLVGVEGPSGFMPVSNLLEFPLFPEKSGELAIFPSAKDVPGFPDFLIRIMGQDQAYNVLSRGESSERSNSASRGYNQATVYRLNDSDNPSSKPEDKELFYLWRAWAWKIWSSFENPEKRSWKKDAAKTTSP